MTSQDDIVISTRGLSRSFNSHVALEALDLDIHAGEILALLGPNGAGKTTTVRLLNGVLTPDRGTIQVLGFDPNVDGIEVRRRTGVLTETAGLDGRLTARENLEFTARVRGFSTTESRQRVDLQLNRFDMYDMAEFRTAGFSTGQKKRLALARALLHDPEILFLDEPTSGLDPAATREVTDLIGSLAREHGRTVLLATHFLGEAGRIADRMAVLDHGRLRAIGRPDDLASQLWNGIPADIDLGGPATSAAVEVVARVEGVISQETRAAGMTIAIRDRDTMARVLAALASSGHAVYGASMRQASMEDVYFALENSSMSQVIR